MVLSKFPVPGRLTIWITIWQGRTALSVGVGVVVWTFFSCLSFLSSFSLSLGEARYRLKYYLNEPLNPKQPTNQSINP